MLVTSQLSVSSFGVITALYTSDGPCRFLRTRTTTSRSARRILVRPRVNGESSQRALFPPTHIGDTSRVAPRAFASRRVHDRVEPGIRVDRQGVREHSSKRRKLVISLDRERGNVDSLHMISSLMSAWTPKDPLAMFLASMPR